MPFEFDTFPFGDPYPSAIQLDLGASFSPELLPNLYLWLDANDLSTLFQDSAGATPVTSNNDPVGRWVDKSGNNRNFTQGTSGSRPLYKSNQNGTPGVKFDEVDDWLQLLISAVSGYEYYFIYHSTRSSFPGPANNVDPILTTSAGGQQGFNSDSYNGFGTTANARFQVLNGVNTWLDGSSFINGGATTSNRTHIGSATVGSPVVNTGQYMGKFSDSTHLTPDAVKGLLVYSTTHTDSERALIHAWAMQSGRYGI